MRFIPTRIHGAIDYLMALVLIAAPWALGFGRDGGAETWVPVALGVAIAGMSLLTDYEWGVSRLIPMPTHLFIDAAGGIFRPCRRGCSGATGCGPRTWCWGSSSWGRP